MGKGREPDIAPWGLTRGYALRAGLTAAREERGERGGAGRSGYNRCVSYEVRYRRSARYSLRMAHDVLHERWSYRRLGVGSTYALDVSEPVNRSCYVSADRGYMLSGHTWFVVTR